MGTSGGTTSLSAALTADSLGPAQQNDRLQHQWHDRGQRHHQRQRSGNPQRRQSGRLRGRHVHGRCHGLLYWRRQLQLCKPRCDRPDRHGPLPPTVTNVAVSGPGWASAYAIPVGSGTQLFSLPWAGINQIKVTFSENVVVDQSDLLLTGINVPSYDVAGGTFSYDSTTFTATWTLPQSIGADQLMLALNANGSDPIRLTPPARILDGDWTNPASTTATSGSAYPSGNGTAGGNFNFRFNVLPGDANQDGLVNISDLTVLASHWQQTGQGLTVRPI